MSYIHIPRSAKECEGMNPHIPKWIPILGLGVLIASMNYKKIKPRTQQGKQITINENLSLIQDQKHKDVRQEHIIC